MRARWQTFRKQLIRRRRGSEVLEAALIFPMLLFLAFGTVEFGYYFFVQHNLEGAAREALGAAVPEGLSPTERADEIESAIDRVMTASGYSSNAYDISVDYLQDDSYVKVNVDMRWSEINEGLRPMRMVKPENDLVRGSATMRIEN